MITIRVVSIPASVLLEVELRELKLADLRGFQELVGGYLEVVTLTQPEASLYIDEEGKIKGLPLNIRATALARTCRPGFSDVILGPAVLCGPPDEVGMDTAISQYYIDLIQAE